MVVRLVTSIFLTTAAADAMDALKTVIQETAKLKRDEGIVRLSSCFQWREFEGDEQKQHIHQEFVYENVMYSVQRGLPWAAVAQIAKLSKELLPELRGLKRSEAVSLIQTRLLQCVQRLSPSHHTTLYDFMVQTYIHHQYLYQVFLKDELNRKCMHSHLKIYVPPHPLPLSEGTDLGVWEKKQALRELMAAETVKLKEIQRLKEQAEAKIMEQPQIRLSALSPGDRLDKQALESMVHSILETEVDTIMEIFLKEIRAVQELLEIRLRQTAVQAAGCSSGASGFSQKAYTSTKTQKK